MVRRRAGRRSATMPAIENSAMWSARSVNRRRRELQLRVEPVGRRIAEREQDCAWMLRHALHDPLVGRRAVQELGNHAAQVLESRTDRLSTIEIERRRRDP